VNVVDSSAWIAYFKDDPNAEKFAGPISNSDNLVVPSITLTEVFKFICRHQGDHYALNAIAQMKQGIVIPLESNLAVAAAEIGLKLQLPLADSIIYATARKFDAVLWTQDVDFKDLPNVKYFLYRE
jgi:predicted nucleic acid-binding protein